MAGDFRFLLINIASCYIAEVTNFCILNILSFFLFNCGDKLCKTTNLGIRTSLASMFSVPAPPILRSSSSTATLPCLCSTEFVHDTLPFACHFRVTHDSYPNKSIFFVTMRSSKASNSFSQNLIAIGKRGIPSGVNA